MALVESVPNVSEGRRPDVVDRLGAALESVPGAHLLDRTSDPSHNRSVFTLAGEDGPVADALERLVDVALREIDMEQQAGEHPRIGAVDVVPFVPLGDDDLTPALVARDAFGAWAAETLAVPCFHYGPERSLPDVRRGAFTTLGPDVGPAEPHPTARHNRADILISRQPAHLVVHRSRPRRCPPAYRARKSVG
jgi:glutamate formiminotransferase